MSETTITDDMLPKEQEDFPESLTVKEVIDAESKLDVAIEDVRIAEVPDFDNREIKVKKPVVTVGTKNGQRAYWPNKTSVAKLVQLLGADFSKWKDKTVVLTTAKVQVRGKGMKDGIFVA